MYCLYKEMVCDVHLSVSRIWLILICKVFAQLSSHLDIGLLFQRLHRLEDREMKDSLMASKEKIITGTRNSLRLLCMLITPDKKYMQYGKTPGTVLDVTEVLTFSNISVFCNHSCLFTAILFCIFIILQSMTTNEYIQ